MKKIIFLLFTCLISAFPAFAQDSGDAKAPEDNVLLKSIPTRNDSARDTDPRIRKAAAIVNGSVVTDLDVDQRLALVVTASGTQVPKEELTRLHAQILRNLIDEKLQVIEAKVHDVTIDDKEVNDAFDRVAQNFKKTPDDFDKFLRSTGSSKMSLHDQIQAELAWNRLLRRRVEPFVNVGDNEVDAVIKKLQDSKGQDQYRIAEIFLAATKENESEITAQANNILKQIKSGASFIAYARQYSESGTAALGGDRGWVAAPQLDPKLKDAISNLKTGEIAGPVRVPAGIYLLLLNEKRKILAPDPLDAVVTFKQIVVPFPTGATKAQLEQMVRTLTASSTTITGCGRAADMAKAVNGKAVDVPSQKIRDLPEGLHAQMINLQIGKSTKPFGTEKEARVLMLCGRDDPKSSTEPSYDEVYAQINEQRMDLAARRYMRDLRRDAVIDYR